MAFLSLHFLLPQCIHMGQMRRKIGGNGPKIGARKIVVKNFKALLIVLLCL